MSNNIAKSIQFHLVEKYSDKPPNPTFHLSLYHAQQLPRKSAILDVNSSIIICSIQDYVVMYIIFTEVVTIMANWESASSTKNRTYKNRTYKFINEEYDYHDQSFIKRIEEIIEHYIKTKDIKSYIKTPQKHATSSI